MSIKNLSPITKSVVIGMWRCGATHLQMNEETGFSPLTIQKIISEYQRSNNYKKTVISDLELSKTYKFNTMPEIETYSKKETITDEEAVYKILAKMGYNFSDFMSVNSRTEEYSFLRHAIIHVLARNGLKKTRIGKLVGRDASICSKSLKAIEKLTNSNHKGFLHILTEVNNIIDGQTIIQTN